MLARVKTGVAAHEAGTHVACDAQSKRALVAGSYGLAAFDIRDVTAPRKMAFVKTGVATFKGGAYVLIKGTTAFVVGGYGLAVIDLGGLNAEPSSMEKIGGCNTGVCTYHGDEACQLRTRPSGDLLFIAGGGGFAVIDVSNVREPVRSSRSTRASPPTLAARTASAHREASRVLCRRLWAGSHRRDGSNGAGQGGFEHQDGRGVFAGQRGHGDQP